MPCSPRKARVLLKGGKARVVKRTPFTIQFWIGKDNIGEENKKRWWLSAGIQHPGCRGYWIREYPEKEEKFGYDFGAIYARRDKEDKLWGEELDEVLQTGAKQTEADFLAKVKKLYNKKMQNKK